MIAEERQPGHARAPSHVAGAGLGADRSASGSAAFAFYVMLLAITLVYVAILRVYAGRPRPRPHRAPRTSGSCWSAAPAVAIGVLAVEPHAQPDRRLLPRDDRAPGHLVRGLRDRLSSSRRRPTCSSSTSAASTASSRSASARPRCGTSCTSSRSTFGALFLTDARAGVEALAMRRRPRAASFSAAVDRRGARRAGGGQRARVEVRRRAGT